jgi:hypothetical protein
MGVKNALGRAKNSTSAGRRLVPNPLRTSEHNSVPDYHILSPSGDWGIGLTTRGLHMRQTQVRTELV